jgi:hypothetical protein
MTPVFAHGQLFKVGAKSFAMHKRSFKDLRYLGQKKTIKLCNTAKNGIFSKFFSFVPHGPPSSMSQLLS